MVKKVGPDLADLITESLLERIKAQAWCMARRTGFRVPADDLFSEGQFALVQSAQRYDHATGVPFEVYATVRSKGAMLDYMRKQDPTARRIRSLIRSAEQKEEGELTAEERKALTKRRVIVHIDGEMEGFLDREQTKSGTPEFLQLDPAFIFPALRVLNPRDRGILMDYFVEEKTLDEIGKKLRLTGSRIQQILRGSMAKVRQRYAILSREAA